MIPKNPRRPPGPLSANQGDVVVHTEALWRVHRTVGPHRQRWAQMRVWGPVDSRWDPHPDPAGDHPASAVMYAAPEVTTALGDVFQTRRAVTLSAAHALVGWTPTRRLKLLDLTGTWAVRNGASASLHAAPRSTCRRWARAIRETWPELDGLRAPSTMTLRPMVVLFVPALDSFPAGPALARALDHPDLSRVVVDAANDLGWEIWRV